MTLQLTFTDDDLGHLSTETVATDPLLADHHHQDPEVARIGHDHAPQIDVVEVIDINHTGELLHLGSLGSRQR